MLLSRNPSILQEPLPEMPQLEQLAELPPVLNLDQSRAFGSVPNLLQLTRTANPELLVSQDDMERTRPSTMYATLFNSAGNYKTGNYVDGVLLNNAEYGHIARNLPALRRQVGARILASRQLSSPAARTEIAHDGVRHMLDGYVERQTKLSRGLQQEEGRLERIQKLAARPGFAHAKAGELLELTAGAWELSFKNMLQTAGEQQGWTEKESVLAEEALCRLLSTGPQRNRIQVWQIYTQLARRYAGVKRRLFEGRTAEISRLITQMEQPDVPATT